MADRVVCTIADGVADVRLNRPEKLNALDMALFTALADTAAALAEIARRAAVVLSGEGRSFCAGLDLTAFSAMAAGERWRPLDDPSGDPTTTGADGRSLGHGPCWPGTTSPSRSSRRCVGTPWAAACSWRSAPTSASPPRTPCSACSRSTGASRPTWQAPNSCPGWSARTSRPSHLHRTPGRGGGGGPRRAVTRIVDDPLAAAHTLAARIAAVNPDAIRANKGLLRQAHGALEDGLAAERTVMARIMGSPNQREAAAAGLEKREPRFT